MRQGAVQSRLQITRPLDALAIGAECPRHRGVIASQRDADLMPFKTLVKRLPTSTETFVVQDYVKVRMSLRAAVSISMPVKPKEPSPVTLTTVLSGWASFAPIAAGVDQPIALVPPNRMPAIEAIGQVPTRAVGIYRNFVGSEPLVPGIHPLFFKLADFFGDNPIHPLAPSAQFLCALLEQCLQKEF